jgi:hypothetical protein
LKGARQENHVPPKKSVLTRLLYSLLHSLTAYIDRPARTCLAVKVKVEARIWLFDMTSWRFRQGR